MAKKGITLELRAKNLLARGLAGAKAGLDKLGDAAARIGRRIAVGFLAAGAAVIGFGVKALTLYAKQEEAERGLAASIRAYGEEAEKVLPALKKMAQAIQDETGIADELTLARMARLKLLGVETAALGDAAKATIALTRAGVGEETAMKALSAARAGDYSQLTRYIPALRTATTEAQKAAALNDVIARGYQEQKDVLRTVSGAWRMFKGRVGDAWEEIGRAIEKAGGIQRALEKAGEAVKAFGQRVREWVDSERFKALQQSIEGIVKAMAAGGEKRAEAMGLLGELLKASFAVAAETAVDILKLAAPVIGSLIGRAASAALQALKPVFADEARVARDRALEEDPGFRDRYGAAGMRERKKMLTDLVRQHRLEKALNDLGVEAAENTEDQSAAQARLSAILEKIKETYPGIAKEAEATAGAVEKTGRAAGEAFIDVAAAAQRDRIKQIDDEIKKVQELQKANERMAQTSVRDYIDSVRQRMRAERHWERDVARARRLRAKAEPLTRGEQMFLDAVTEIGAARQAVAGGAAAESALTRELSTAENMLVATQHGARAMDKVASEVHGMRTDLKKLLTAG